MKMNQKELWIGIGIGVTVGITGGYFVGTHFQKKKDRKKAQEQAKRAYLKGVDEATAEAKTVIDDLMSNTVVVSAEDDENVIKQKISEHFSGEKEQKSDGEASEEEPDGQKKPPEEPPAGKNDDKYGEKEGENAAEHNFPFTLSGDNAIFYGAAGTELRYPKFLVVNKYGELLDATEIRENMRNYEPDIRRLSVIWNTMGWGTYVPELDGPPGGGKNAWDEDLGIDDEDGTVYGDEPEEKTRERERYLDELERYIAHPEEAPRMISKEEFNDECYLDKIYIDYYDVDKKFVENTDMDREIDAYTMFGVTDGDELFRKKVPDDDEDSINDPDIVHVKNYHMNCVMEVTRFHRAYESIRDGSAFVHGGSD